jgi:hypothetical protein
MKSIFVKNIAKRINKSTLCILITFIIAIPTGTASITFTSSDNMRNPLIFSTTDTIIVDDDGSADYTTIQAAINNANPGDYIIVKNGLYGDQLTINVSNLTISAASGETPTIYVGAYTVGIDVTASDVFLQGFEIYGNGEPSVGPYPTIRASAGSQGLSVISNSFKVITGLIGQVALLITSNIQDITISKNVVQNYTIGILLQENSQATIAPDNIWGATYSINHAARIDNGYLYYGSIQDAISNTEIGQTVNVLNGIFNENIIIDRPLTLKGLQAGINPNENLLQLQSLIVGDTTHAISITSGLSQVTIDGFTITISNKSNSANGAGIIIGMNTQDITIKNNIIQNINDGPGIDTLADETYGIMVYGRDPVGGQSDITITDNLIQNVEEYGIAINDKTSEVTIQGNVIKNLLGSNHSDFPDPSWPSYVCAAIHLGGQVGPIVNVTIIGNTLSTNAMGNGTTSAAGGGISFAGVPEWTNPFNLWKGFRGITIRNNKIFDNTMGIITLIGNFTDTPQIHFNNISENSEYGINNTLTTNISATNNWWGDPKGPYHPVKNPNGTGNQISDYVLFSPWSEIDDYLPPEIEITKPVPGIYLMNYKVWSRYPYPLTFGPITIQVEASDSISGIYKIEFYKKYHNGTALVQTTYELPYEWYWNEKTWGFYEIEIIATDNAGLKTTVRIDYIFVMNLGVFVPKHL